MDVMHDVDAVNTGYARLILDEYLDDPDAVAPEWRALFEGGEAVAGLPGLDRLLARAARQRAAARRGARAERSRCPSRARRRAPRERSCHRRGRASAAEQNLPRALAPQIAATPEAEAAPRGGVDIELLGGVAAGMALVKAYRMHGHLAADLDPLGSAPVGDPALDPMRLHPPLTPQLQARVPASVLRVHVDGETLAQTLPQLRATYCGAMAYEIEHISDHFQRVWLRKAIESWRYRKPLADSTRRDLYARLCEVEALEHYLRRAFIGQKQFSIEGLDVLIPMLDSALTLARGSGVRETFIGMAHRGRLNVLAHIVGVPYGEILREFEGERTVGVVAIDAEAGTGDVKYHLGAEGVFKTSEGKMRVTLAANPSHLEAVNPVVEGMTRARQTDRSSRDGAHDPSVAMPILLHGDAAFAGQGIVAETLNLYALEGYATGGTLHVITNNQIGFTTDPTQGRSTRYSSDLAKGYDTPIIHVNADDPEAALSAVSLALAYRARFGHDIVIDLVGYRRFGHNEQDEPSYTQPLMTGQIAHHPTVRQLYGMRLHEEGVLDLDEVESLLEEAIGRVRVAHDTLRGSLKEERGDLLVGRAPAQRGDRRDRHARRCQASAPADQAARGACRTASP